jgi:hypothetical protein
MATLRKQKAAPAGPNPDGIYVVAVPFVNADGAYRAGTRLRGDHPAVVAHYQQFFGEDGTDPGSWPSVFDSASRIIEEQAAQEQAAREAREKARAAIGRVRCVKSPPMVGVRGASGPMAPSTAALRLIQVGDVLAANDPIVGSFPGCFEAVEG